MMAPRGSQVMYRYVHQKDITVLSSYDPNHPEWLADDLGIFNMPGGALTAEEMASLDALTPGKRTCPDCFTFECQACAQALIAAKCPTGPTHGGFIWGRSNPQGEECVACAALPANVAAVGAACGDAALAGTGESLETMVPKACGI